MLLLVNMTPQSLSGESNQDSEPNLSINPAKPNQIAATAFTPDPLMGPNAPIYLSEDGGQTWRLNSVIPGAGSLGTQDVTCRFGGAGTLYAGDLRGNYTAPDNEGGQLNILRTADATAGSPMQLLSSRTNDDQPYLAVGTPSSGPDSGKDRLYVGNNDLAAPIGPSGTPATATIDFSLDAARAGAAFKTVRIESRTTGTARQDGPQVRTAVHHDGAIYAVFYGWRSYGPGQLVSADVVVVRDDDWGSGANPFSALVDPIDGQVGIRVANGISFVFDESLGFERTGGDLSIAVDPNAAHHVCVAWADKQSGTYTLHVSWSKDAGTSWSGDLLTLPRATNPALAINSDGEIGMLYQQYSAGSPPRWETHVRRSHDGQSWDDIVLSDARADVPAKQFDPYLGDYIHLTAVGRTFYGIFCANNDPNPSHFPNGVHYQRNVDPSTHGLLANDGVTPVANSIDPFFTAISRPTVTNVSPSSGSESGGETVTITGQGFSGAMEVAFGSRHGSSLHVLSDTSLRIIAPPGAGVVDLTVTAPGGTSMTNAADRFTYVGATAPPTGTALPPGTAATGNCECAETAIVSIVSTVANVAITAINKIDQGRKASGV